MIQLAPRRFGAAFVAAVVFFMVLGPSSALGSDAVVSDELAGAELDCSSDGLQDSIDCQGASKDKIVITEVMQNPAIWVWRGGQQCSPTVYVDRHMIAPGTGGAVRLDDFVTPAEVDAIEVYTRPSEVPVGFDEINNCGVILIWTRTR